MSVCLLPCSLLLLDVTHSALVWRDTTARAFICDFMDDSTTWQPTHSRGMERAPIGTGRKPLGLNIIPSATMPNPANSSQRCHDVSGRSNVAVLVADPRQVRLSNLAPQLLANLLLLCGKLLGLASELA